MKKAQASLLLVLVGAGSAFQIQPRRLAPRVASSQAEDHLEELVTEWETLAKEVKGFSKDSNPDKSKAKELTAQVLKTAIDHAHTQEEIEEEHVIQAHLEFEQALQEEDQLAMTMPLLVDSTDYWMEPFRPSTRLHENGTLLEKQVYQYLTTDNDPLNGNLGMPGPMKLMEEKHDSRLEVAHEKELHALDEESQAKRTLEELKKNEEMLKETLRELEALQAGNPKETIEDLNKVEHEPINGQQLMNEFP